MFRVGSILVTDVFLAPSGTFLKELAAELLHRESDVSGPQEFQEGGTGGAGDSAPVCCHFCIPVQGLPVTPMHHPQVSKSSRKSF